MSQKSENPFALLPRTPESHFKLYFYAAVLRLLERLISTSVSAEEVFERFPFLAGYNNELAENGLEGISRDEAANRWRDALYAWEGSVSTRLPLRALREGAGLDHEGLVLFLSIGAIEEDLRFGALFEALQSAPAQRGLTVGLLNTWWPDPEGDGSARRRVQRLIDLGLVRPTNPEAPRVEWSLQVHGLVWDLLRGDTQETLSHWARYRSPDQLPTIDDLIVSESVRRSLAMTPSLLSFGDAGAVVIRGPLHNGRRTGLGAIARAMGRGVIEITGLKKPDDQQWKVVGVLATTLHALPVIVMDLAPAETAEAPVLAGYEGPVGIVLGRQGGVRGEAVERAVTIVLDLPDPDLRHQHWMMGIGSHAACDLDDISTRFRMTGGNIRRAAGLACTHAALAGRDGVMAEDVQLASRALNRQALDTLASRLTTSGDWSQLAVGSETLSELFNLERRCRNRERLCGMVGASLASQLNCGVRALFSGPSGTGKTMAARLLASVLGMDLYRLDLSSVVNKYIGETEKNLNEVFSRAEELDVILLIDEGDALLTERTSVQTSNDRYANLETNFLLQRLESFEGILIVTTNAAERIDGAFQRRMDVVVEFRAPDPAERWAIWRSHLPSDHSVDDAFLRDVATRCALTGGQIRNAVLHASLLAMENGRVIKSGHLESAVQREYRKLGAVCPLRRASAVIGA